MNKLIHASLMGAAALVLVVLSGCGGGSAGAGTPASGTNTLSGTVRGPVGASVQLLNNGGDATSVTVAHSVGVTDQYDEKSFSFPTSMANLAAYSVSIASAATGQTCSVYKGATGNVPVTATSLRVGCEYTYDLVSRSSNDSVLSYGTYNQEAVIGGAAVSVGSTTQGYGEGRFVAFVSYAPGIATGVSGSYRQVLWRDRLTGETKLVSATAAGVEGNGDSTAPTISADGLWVAFESAATNLAGTDANGVVKDVYIWSAAAPAPAGVQLVSQSAAGIQGNAASFEPTLSADGKVVAFSTFANNLAGTVAGTTNSNVILRNLPGNTNTLVSFAAGTSNEGNFASSHPSLSEDGKRVAFWSYASNLVAGDTDTIWDIFVYDVTAGSNTLVSYVNGGALRNPLNDSSSASRVVTPTISGNGRYVAYASPASDLVSGDTGGFQDVFVVDTQIQTVTRASVTSAGVQGNADSPVGQGERIAMSYDGSWVAFNTNATNLGTTANNVVMHTPGETRVVSNQSASYASYVAMSRTGAYASFLTGAQGLDSRFNSSGVIARFTGVARSWWWID